MLELSREEVEAIKTMMLHPGWSVIKTKVIPARLKEASDKIIATDYRDIGQVYADQAAVRTLRDFPLIIEQIVHPLPYQPAKMDRPRKKKSQGGG